MPSISTRRLDSTTGPRHAVLAAIVATAAVVLLLWTAIRPATAAEAPAPDPSGDVTILADHSMYTNDQSWPYDPAGRMWFNEYGDVVTLCDNDADGQRVYLSVTVDGPTRYGLSVGGEGNCVTGRAAMGGKYNLPENRYITFEISASGDPEASYNHAAWLNDH